MSVTTNRGEPRLQPNYFSSSIFVKAFRDDITSLIHTYHETYAKDQSPEPFSLFKQLWVSLGWKLVHLKITENRARDAFLEAVCRMFLERMVKTEAPFTRAIALYGLYTFFYTQPSDSLPPLHRITHIPIPLDHYSGLLAFPETLSTPYLTRLAPAARHAVSQLERDDVFIILPSSEYGAMRHRVLPYEIIVNGTSRTLSDLERTKKGRPSKRERARRAKTAVDNLQKWMKEAPQLSLAASRDDQKLGSPTVTAEGYRHYKNKLLDLVADSQAVEGPESIEVHTLSLANQNVYQRLKVAEASLNASRKADKQSPAAKRIAIERVEESLRDGRSRGGLLSLFGN